MKALTILLCLLLLSLIVLESFPAERVKEIPIKIYVNHNGMIYGEFFGNVIILL